MNRFLLTPLREGRPSSPRARSIRTLFLLTPLREGRLFASTGAAASESFLLTPLREGRPEIEQNMLYQHIISTHAPAGGATATQAVTVTKTNVFLLTPLREGRPSDTNYNAPTNKFLLTPLREGRPFSAQSRACCSPYFYSRPCGRGDKIAPFLHIGFLDFYSRPCGRGDSALTRF